MTSKKIKLKVEDLPKKMVYEMLILTIEGVIKTVPNSVPRLKEFRRYSREQGYIKKEEEEKGE